MKPSISSLAAVALLVPTLAFAQDPAAVTTVAGATQWGLGLAFLGAAIATFMAGTGSIMGVSMVGQSGAGLLTEKPELTGRVITLMVLPGSQGLYGMVITLLFLFNFAPIVTGEVAISTSQGLVLFSAFLPVAITGLSSAPFQAKVCSAGMHMIAKDDKLTGRVITMAALVETYALLGFLVSFFMLNNYQVAILG